MFHNQGLMTISLLFRVLLTSKIEQYRSFWNGQWVLVAAPGTCSNRTYKTATFCFLDQLVFYVFNPALIGSNLAETITYQSLISLWVPYDSIATAES